MLEFVVCTNLWKAKRACDRRNKRYHFDYLYLQEPVNDFGECELLIQQKYGPIVMTTKNIYRQRKATS